MAAFTVVLVGRPNVGKSSLINAISGAKLRVGNFGGVTIEKAEATITQKGHEIKVIDLPGTYSLGGYTAEERITREFLINEKYDLLLNVVDVTNLERNLILTMQLKRLGKPTLIALNMADEAEKDGIKTDCEKLSLLLGMGVCSVSSTKVHNINILVEEMVDKCLGKKAVDNDKNLERIAARRFVTSEQELVDAEPRSRATNIGALMHSDAVKAREIARMCQIMPRQIARNTAKIDRIMLHRVWGIPVFLAVMLLLFQCSFTLGTALQDIVQEGVDALGEFAGENVSNEFLSSLLSDGIIQGVGTVLSFLPLISLLFLGITILEGSGYMARVVFLLDGLFSKFGMHGKSFIPLVTGFGCSVPAYMATRTLQNRAERLITLFVIGFMSCSARLPIYSLFIATFFDGKYAGLILFTIYAGGALIALVCAKVLKLTLFRGENEPFVMEMPRYRFPTLRVVWFSVWSKSYMFVKKAGTVILLGAVIVWFISQFPKSEEIKQAYETKIEAVKDNSALSEDEKDRLIGILENEMQEGQLEYSMAGRAGRLLTPVFAPMGFDWRLSVSLVTGFSAKEIVVSTLGVLYSLGDKADENDLSLQDKLRRYVSVPSSIAFIVFVMCYIPCVAATISFAQENGCKMYAVYLFIFTTVVAYVLGVISYQIANALM